MKKLTAFILMAICAISTPVLAQSDARTQFKDHINEMVQKVEKTPDPEKKRIILNSELDKLITAIGRVGSMERIPEEDRTQLAAFKDNLQEKHDELNGKGDFNRVRNNQLNNFANFIQQDIEQADRVVTLSLTTLLLIIIILLLL